MRIALLLHLACWLPASGVAEDWPQWLGPRRDGASSEQIQPWSGPLKPAWSTAVGEGHSSPIIARGRVFLHTKVADEERERVEAFDASTGARIWEKSYPRTKFTNQFGNGPRSTPLWHDGRLYTLGVTGILTCWNAENGAQQWQIPLLERFNGKNLFFGISTTPLICDDLLLVMVGAPTASIVALDRKTGEVKWQQGDDPASYASPILTAKGDAIFLTARGVRAVEPASGAFRWFHRFVDLLNESSSTPVQAGNRFVVSSVTAGMLCLDQTQPLLAPVEAWKAGKLCCYFATPIAWDEHLYVVTGSLPPAAQANLHCVELASGKILWTRPKVGTYHATLLRTKDRLLLLEEEGELVLLEPDIREYKELCRAKICGQTWAHPALADGRIYIRDANELRCIPLR